MIFGALRPGTATPSVVKCFQRDGAGNFKLNEASLAGLVDPEFPISSPHIIDPIRSSQRPSVGIFGEGIESTAIAEYGSQKYPDADWLVIPRIPGNTFVQGSRVFVHSAVRYDQVETGELGAKFMVFSEPVHIDRLFSMVPYATEIEEKLVSFGYTVSNAETLRRVANDKAESHRIFEELGIRSPRFVVLDPSEKRTWNSYRAEFEEFISRHGISDFVVKPVNGSRGKDVRMAKADDPGFTFNMRNLLSRGKKVLIEERIKSYPFMIEGERVDWNIRVVIPPGDLIGWDILDTTEVRCNYFNSHPVNKCQGAQIVEIDTVFDHIGLPEESRKKIIEGLYSFSHGIRNGLRDRLAQKAGAKADFYEQFLGLDVIVDENLNLFLIEVNAGAVGGIGSLLSIREGEAKFRTVDLFTRNLYESARAMHSTHTLESGNTDREYLEDSHSCVNLSGMLMDRAESMRGKAGLWSRWFGWRKDVKLALRMADKAIAIDPDNIIAWYCKSVQLAALGRYRRALRSVNKVLSIDPDFSGAWKLKSSLLSALGATLASLMCTPSSYTPPSIDSAKLKLNSAKNG